MFDALNDETDPRRASTDSRMRNAGANARKRSKPRLNLLKLAAEKLDAKTNAVVDGRRVSKAELGAIKLVNSFAEKGDIEIFKYLFELLQKDTGPEVRYIQPPENIADWSDNEIFEASTRSLEFLADAHRQHDDDN